jgi:hypothetical protein
MANMTDLEELGTAGHQNARADQQEQTDSDPYEVIDYAIDFSQLFEKVFHIILSPNKKLRRIAPPRNPHKKQYT